jgi:hypothetical protein
MHIVQWRLIAWAALGAGLLAAPALAAPPTGSPGTPNNSTTTQPAPRVQIETAQGLLRDARQLLKNVQFSYGGHRALAEKEIDRALSELGPKKIDHLPPNVQMQSATTTRHATTIGRATTGQPTYKGQLPKQQETTELTQVQAEGKLREAIALLTRAQKRAADNPNATEDIAAAITQLQEALKTQP